MYEWLMDLPAWVWITYSIVVLLGFGLVKGSIYPWVVRVDRNPAWWALDDVFALFCAFTILGAGVMLLSVIMSEEDRIGFRVRIPKEVR